VRDFNAFFADARPIGIASFALHTTPGLRPASQFLQAFEIEIDDRRRGEREVWLSKSPPTGQAHWDFRRRRGWRSDVAIGFVHSHQKRTGHNVPQPTDFVLNFGEASAVDPVRLT
jgi:hypothetical protein